MSKEWETLAAQIRELQRQLAEVTKERDQYKAALELADALRNRENRFGKNNPASMAPYGYFKGEK